MKKIAINPKGGPIFVDLESDPEHLARYTIVLWQKNPAGKWERLPDQVSPPSSNTRDPGHHTLSVPPDQVKGKALQVFVAVGSTVTKPRALNLVLYVWQGPENLKLQPQRRSQEERGQYPIDGNDPVPPGDELTFDVAWEFEQS